MDIQRLTEIQNSRGATFKVSEANRKSYDYILSECRKYINERSESYRNLESGRKEKIKELILAFVNSNKYLVDGYITDDGNLDVAKLLEALTDSIQNYGILTFAMEDPSIFEIRGNGKEIKVEQNGRCVDLVNPVTKQIVRFTSAEEQETILRKMMGDVRLSPKDAVVNARTVEGYRLAVVHSSATGADPDDSPDDDKYHVFVLRKFKKSKMDLGDIAKFGTISDNMARLMALFMRGSLTFFTCGPTASGKSTTNNAIIQYCPLDKRLVLLQNPSEIDGRLKDAYGRTINDVIHLEYIEKEHPGPNDPTKEHMMEQILRLSPNFIVFGEWRADSEFKRGIQLGESGHALNSTLHAEDSAGALQRIQTAYLAGGEGGGGGDPALALANIVGVVNFIIIQHILADGRRRVLQVTEVVGIDPKDRNKAILNDLYRYEYTGNPKYDKDGRVIEIPGVHKRVGKISQRTIDKFHKAGVTESQYAFLLKDPDPEHEIETYTGENIRNYGVHFGEDE
jgi:pilus assembly protein CpaF